MDTPLITVLVNGEAKQVPPNQTVSALLTWLNLPSERIAIELNKQIVRKRDWTQAAVSDHAHIEIVEFVGGG